MKKIYFILIFITSSVINTLGQDDYDRAFDIQAIVTVSAPSVKLKWELTSYNTSLSVQRKLREDANFGSAVVLPANATEYIDNTVQVGKIYEYHVYSTVAHEYISVAINSSVIDNRGKVLLLVEKSLNTPLAFEINRLMMDMRGDGWQVIKIDVDKTATPPAVKTLIQNAYNEDKTNVKAVFLIGQIAQPLSGCQCTDGHCGGAAGNHLGPWATDTYYADPDGNWTDIQTFSTNYGTNVPGDGIFDQNNMPSDAELQVGRVDMSNLPSFTESYTALTKRYLNKDHYFRSKIISAPRKGLVLDFFHWGFAWCGYYYFDALFGKSNTKKASTVDYTTTDNLWGYACAAGGPNGFIQTDWITSAFAKKSYNCVFSMLFGSYFGDYQFSDDFLKAALASKGWILSTSYAGQFGQNPNWVYHHMATGDNIGYVALVNMNNNIYYGADKGFITINLLGDPTLRQDMISPPLNVKSSVVSNHVKIIWSPSTDVIEGYHIFKSKGLDSVFTRVTSSVVTDTFWTDPAVADAQYYYQVKAYRLETGRCGAYGNTSTGIFASNDALVKDYPIIINKPYVLNHIPDKSGYIKKSFYYALPLSTTFADDDPIEIDMPVYEVYKADSTALPKGWYFSSLSNSIGVSPLPAKPIKFKVVVKAIDMTQNYATDTFEINIIDPAQNIISTLSSADPLCIYPNPATTSVKVSFYSECNGSAEMTVVDIAGKQISAGNITAVEGSNETDMSIESLADGIYFITVKTSGHIYKGRVVIAK
jgi:hypothetical protein